MKICVVTMYTKEIDVMGKLTDINKKQYCDKHGYEYNVHYGRISNRHAAWDKILAVQRLLPYYDYVLWVDADCIFNNMEKRIEQYIGKCGFFCMDIACNENNTKWHNVNTGVFLLKNCNESFRLLDTVWSTVDYSVENIEKRSYNGWPWDQGPVCEYLLKSDDFIISKEQEFNCHPNIATDDVFIIHYMGWRSSLENELNTLETIKRKINPDHDMPKQPSL